MLAYYLLIMSCVAATCSSTVITERPFAQLSDCSKNATEISASRNGDMNNYTSCIGIMSTALQVSRLNKEDKDIVR